MSSATVSVEGMLRTSKMLLAALACAFLVACGAQSPQTGPTATPSVTATDGVIRMVAVGDSITAADSPDIDGGDPGPQSWVSYAAGAEIEYIGGWAVWGAPTEQMAEGITGPFEADVLVILAGTNDAGRAPFAEIAANLEVIVQNAGVETVVLSSVPPLDSAPENATELNTELESFAQQQGWVWVDAAAELRDGDVFAEGMAYDGVHPTEAGAEVIGEAIRAAILEVFGTS